MKLAATFVAFALANQQVNQDEKKFSDDDEWIAGENWETYNDQPPAVRLEQLYCRINQFFNQWFSGNLSQGAIVAKSKLSALYQSAVDDITKSYMHCAEDYEDYTPTGKECRWTDWLGVSFEKDLDLFVRWPAMFVRQNIHRSNKKKRCKKNGERLFKRMDRLNAYIQWQYCDKIDDSTKACSWRYNTNKKKNTSPRDVDAHTSMKQFQRDYVPEEMAPRYA